MTLMVKEQQKDLGDMTQKERTAIPPLPVISTS